MSRSPEAEVSVRLGAPLPSDPPIRRIAVVRANNIGDFVVATPAFRALRAAYPRAEIVHIGDPRTRPLAERLTTYIDGFEEFPGFPGIRERTIEPRRILGFLARAQKERFDLAIQLHGNGVWSNPFTSLLGARLTVGFVRAEDSAEAMGLDRSLVHPRCRHEILRLLDLLGEMGIPPCGLDLEVPLRAADHAEAQQVLATVGVPKDRPIVAMHPGGRFGDRIWPAERFARVADALVENHRAGILLTGAGADRAYVAAVREASRNPLVDLTDRLTLPGLAALIDRVDVFISNDTGPAHLAYAMGTPSVTLFGTAPAWEWGSLDPSLHVSIEPGAGSPEGAPDITSIRTADVLAAAELLLSEWPRSSRSEASVA